MSIIAFGLGGNITPLVTLGLGKKTKPSTVSKTVQSSFFMQIITTKVTDQFYEAISDLK